MVRLMTDDDLERLLDMPLAIGAIEEALRERAAGSAVSLPRQALETGESALVCDRRRVRADPHRGSACIHHRS
jgi:ornithine cyclodeaminase/alanine dehydrogenase-like protein (mu-crystallin family)